MTFFAEQCTPLKNNSVLLVNQKLLTQSRLVSLEFNENEILKIIRPLNIHKAHIHDDISIRMIKSCGKSLLKPLILLFQNSIKLSCYPNIWKRSNIRDGLRVGSGCRAPSPLFCNRLFFFGHFEELPIVFIEVKLIISNARFDIRLLKYSEDI